MLELSDALTISAALLFVSALACYFIDVLLGFDANLTIFFEDFDVCLFESSDASTISVVLLLVSALRWYFRIFC